MSDPTARRADALNRLLYSMAHTQEKKGWTLYEMRRHIFKQYRGGVRDQTIDMAIKQLKELGFIREVHGRFFAVDQAI